MISFGVATRAKGLGSRIFGTLFFLVFGGMGLLFCVLMVREVYTIAQTYTWQKTDCLVLDSKAVEELTDGESPYHFHVKYQYTWQGKSFTSEQFSRKPARFSEYNKTQRLVEKFKSDRPNTCYVNPNNPAEAILQRDDFWIVPFALIPLLFVAIGFGGVYAMWRTPKASDTVAQTGPVTDKARPPKLMFAFFGVFFVAGAAVCWFAGLQPLYKILSAKSWQPVPCKVESSRVQSHSGEHGSTYSIDILYAYEFNGQEYKSSRYDFVTGSSSGHEGKARIVRSYPQGAKTTCYVNPNHPYEAVLNRGFRMDILWWGILFPIPFLAVGIGGLFWSMRKKEPGRVSAKSFYRPNPPPATAPKPILKSQGSRFGKFLGLFFFAALWNGFISIPLREIWQSWQHHHLQWGLALFMIPFVLVGLVVIGLAVHSFLALFNPKVIVKLTPPSPALGNLVHVHWTVEGNASRLRHLRIYLEGREEVQHTETQGKRSSTHTTKSPFATFELANLDRAELMASGDAELKIPAHTVPTFTASHNKIIWAIHVEGDIPHWPDIKDEFPVTVLPLPVEQIATA